MSRYNYIFVPLILLTLCCSINSENSNSPSPIEWYISGTPDSSKVDIFYIVSTNVATPNAPSYRATLSRKDLAAYNKEMQFINTHFGDSFNIISPFYHQFTLPFISLDEQQQKPVITSVSNEIIEAFDYYIKHINNGRRFIIMGFSQGAMMTLEVVKHLTPAQLNHFVCAYMMGYRLSESDLHHPNIKAAASSDDIHTVISFNSVASTNGIWSYVTKDAATCINPVNWTISSTPAQLNDSISVTIDTTENVLIVSGYPTNPFYAPILRAYVNQDNMHIADLILYIKHIKKNALVRKRVKTNKTYQK